MSKDGEANMLRRLAMKGMDCRAWLQKKEGEPGGDWDEDRAPSEPELLRLLTFVIYP